MKNICANAEMDANWLAVLEHEFKKPYFTNLCSFLKAENKNYAIYPEEKDTFNAFCLTPFENVKVVMLGQDPYHGSGQAHGLCFSVKEGVKKPPSLTNIFKELNTDLGINIPQNGSLVNWAKQGVFLLNATLTVRAEQPGSHQGKGWEIFTDEIIRCLSDKKENLVFLLWGGYAQAKENLIDSSKHLILKAAHPSPFSVYRGFYGCRHFSKANAYLISKGKKPINWDL